MLSETLTVTVNGFDTEIVHVETDTMAGLPALTIVGLPDLTVRESRERIHAAIVNSGYRFPSKRITINLAPADTRKLGSHFDLPMAAGVYASGEGIDRDALAGKGFLGELSLSGKVNRLDNCLALVIGLRQHGIRDIFLPEENLRDAAVVNGIRIFPLRSFRDVAEHLDGQAPIEPVVTPDEGFRPGGSGAGVPGSVSACPDFVEVYGQERAKRALQICAAGRHDLSMIGPPGSGKTMLARRMPSILPELGYDEMLEITKIHSIAGEPLPDGIVSERPFRAPHHSATVQALVGGGSRPKPGEVSLAHMGVLFLDELPEFARHAIDALRQPLEDGFVTISRATSKQRYPSDLILVTAMNPCPCGYFGHPGRECACSEGARQRYFSKVSGPLRDRIDLSIDIGPVEFASLTAPRPTDSLTSAQLREGVLRVSRIQAERYRGEGTRCNAQLSPAQIERHCAIDAASERMLEAAYNKYGLSARAGNKIRRVARTIADLDRSENIRAEHLAEAISYRAPSCFA